MKFKVFPIPIPGNLQEQAIGDFMSDYLVDNQMTDFLDDLDTRKNLPNWNADHSTSQPDGFIDFILDLQRKTLWGGAYPNLFPINYVNPQLSTRFSLTLGPKTLRANKSSSCYVGDLNWRSWAWVNNTTYHDLAHAFFKNAHVFFNNGLTGDYFASNSGWGMMMANGNLGCNNTSNAWESYINGWNQPKTILSGNHTLKIDDFCHSLPVEAINLNDAIRIKIPKSDQFLWLEYHSKNSVFDYGDNPETHYGDLIISDKGLYGMIEDMGTLTRNVNYGGYQSKANALKPIHKDGNYEFHLGDFPLRGSTFGGGQDLPEYTVSYPRPFSIQNKLTISRLKTPYWPRDYFTFLQSQNLGGLNEVTIPRFRIGSSATEFVGDNLAFGNKGNSEILGLNSNAPIFNYPKFYFNSQDFDPIILNGLEVEVMPRVPNLPMELKVRFDKNVFLTNQVLNGFFHLFDLSDLNPDISIGQGVIIRLDKSINPNRTNKGPNNLFPDFITPSRFICKAGSRLVLEPNSTFIIENESGLVIEPKAEVFLQAGAKIVVKSGCTFHLHAQARIKVEAGARIEIEDNTYYCINPGYIYLPGSTDENFILLGSNLGATGPKFRNGGGSYRYIEDPTGCASTRNIPVSFACNVIHVDQNLPGRKYFVSKESGPTQLLISPFSTSGLSDGKYTVVPEQDGEVPSIRATYASQFYLYGQNGVSTFNTDMSLSNLVIFNSGMNITNAQLTVEPFTNFYIKGIPVTEAIGCPSGTVCPKYVTGGDIDISANAKLNIREGATLQGMCGNMWGGIKVRNNSELSAYNNMNYRDSYDGIFVDKQSSSSNDGVSISLHLQNARFENNYQSIVQKGVKKVVSIVRNCSFTSDPDEIKAPFNKTSGCNKFISKNHVLIDDSEVKYGNFWNNTLRMAQTGLKVNNQNKNTNFVGNCYESIYGKAIELTDAYHSPILFEKETITVPVGELFCADDEGDANYITRGGQYGKAGIFSNAPANFRLRSCTLKGSSAPTLVANNVGIYAHGGGEVDLRTTTLQDLEIGVAWVGTNTDLDGTNTLRENTFTNNGTNLLFRSTYKAGYKLELKCNRFTTPASPAPFAMRYGMYIEAGAGMPDIGGTGVDDNPSPAGNWWPSNGTTNPLVSPWPATLNSNIFSVEHWTAPTGWETVKNLTQNEWKYYRYINEYLGPFSNPINQPYFQRITVPRLIVSRVNIPIPGTNQNYPNQVNPQNSGMEMDVGCSNFGAVLVFPTRKAVAEDSSVETKIETRHSETLEQNVPNPANHSTRIGYTLPEDAKFSKLEVFELTTGRIVKSIGLATLGKGHVEFGLSAFAAGIYGYRLICNGRDIGHKKMILVK